MFNFRIDGQKNEFSKKDLTFKLGHFDESGDLALMVGEGDRTNWYALTICSKTGIIHRSLSLPKELGLPIDKLGRIRFSGEEREGKYV
ncbi:hypothetical protein KAR91_80370 [Candidatus Pacearchaeota archaeon]|nr:hypothetical protein [Candidatus Pacearchaeota archaeon]